MAKTTANAANTIATLTVLADPTLKTDLSPPALALATALDSGIGSALGLGKSLSAVGADALAQLAGDVAGTLASSAADILGSTLEAVPLLGQVFSGLMKLYESFGTQRTAAEHCQLYLSGYAAVPTGSLLAGGGFVPADYFAREHSAKVPRTNAADPPPWPLTWIAPSDGLFRSALGMALMQATEGSVIDPFDLTDADWLSGDLPAWNPGAGPYAGLLERIAPEAFLKRLREAQSTDKVSLSAIRRLTWADHVDASYDRAVILWRMGADVASLDAPRGVSATVRTDPASDPRAGKRGLRRPARRRFQALRRGIEAAHRRPGDGGAALWILYMDLLATAFHKDQLSVPFLVHQMAAGTQVGGPGMDAAYWCAGTFAESIGSLASAWRHTVEPSYSAGKEAVANLRVGGSTAPVDSVVPAYGDGAAYPGPPGSPVGTFSPSMLRPGSACDTRSNPMALIYLDHHATTPCDPRVVEAMLPHFSDAFGNPGSRHRFGRDAEEAVEAAREQLAAVIGAAPQEILFTSGATESDNLALRGMLAWSRQRGGHLVTCATEHNAVLKVAEQLRGEGFRCTVLPVDGDGLVDVDNIARVITAGEPTLVSIMAANNEIGTIQPIADIGRLCRERGAVFHCDATQAIGKLPFDVMATCVDLASISGHKMYGPKGVGALYVRRGVCLCPSILGGGQEQGLRAGTSNVPGIVGLGAAAALAQEEMGEEAGRLAALRDELLDQLVAGLGDRVRVNGSLQHRLPGNLSVCIAGVDGRELVRWLDGRGIAVSTGSACSRGITPSHVLRALGRSEQEAWEAVRIGLGRGTTTVEIEVVSSAIVEAAHELRADQAA
jgi:cysteine desulfurase